MTLKHLDTKLSLEKRKKEWVKYKEKFMNPVPSNEFNKDTFDPMKDLPEYEVGKRKRISPPKELPTYGLKPKEIMIGQMIGLYENKQDIYLIFAHKCNEFEKRIEKLEKIIDNKKTLK